MDMTDTSVQLLRFLYVITFALGANAAKTTMGRDSECYTANGRDYEGTQATTYVAGDGAYEPQYPNVEVCLPWKNVSLDFNVTDRDRTLPKNYCRNPNNLLFPYCYVSRNEAQVRTFCHIPTCSTPALIGCFKLLVNDVPSPKDGNVTTTGPPPDLILDGEDSINQDTEMRIARCLNFCRSRKYDYGGVTGGDTCMCGKERVDGPQMRNASNHLHPHNCLQDPCSGDRLQGCGGDNAIAIYDVEAGSCEPVPHSDRDRGVIYSPRWPGSYHNEAACQWTVYVPPRFLHNEEKRKNYQLRVSFSFFKLKEKNDTLKMYAYYNDTSSGSQLIETFTGGGDVLPPEIILEVSEIIALHIVFRTDEDHKHEGFILHYEITNRFGEMETTVPDVVATEPATTTARTTTTATTPYVATKTTLPDVVMTTPTTVIEANTTAVPSKKSTPKTSATSTSLDSTLTGTIDSNLTKINTGPKSTASSSLNSGQIAGITLGVLLFIMLVVLAALALVKYKGKPFKEEVTASSPPAMFDNPVNFSSAGDSKL